MALTLSVSVEGSDKLDQLFKQAPAIVERELKLAVDKAANEVERLSATTAPHATGTLQGSIKAQPPNKVGNDVQSKINVGANYGAFMEFGTSPHMPPVEALKPWARKVLGNEKLAYPIARAIKQRGLKPRKYMQNALENIKPKFTNYMQTAINNILNALSK